MTKEALEWLTPFPANATVCITDFTGDKISQRMIPDVATV